MKKPLRFLSEAAALMLLILACAYGAGLSLGSPTASAGQLPARTNVTPKPLPPLDLYQRSTAAQRAPSQLLLAQEAVGHASIQVQQLQDQKPQDQQLQNQQAQNQQPQIEASLAAADAAQIR